MVTNQLIDQDKDQLRKIREAKKEEREASSVLSKKNLSKEDMDALFLQEHNGY